MYTGFVDARGGWEHRDYFYLKRDIIGVLDSTLGSQKRDIVRDKKLFALWHDFCVSAMGFKRVRSMEPVTPA